MKRYCIAATVALGVLYPAASATAWWQWYHQDIPYARMPGMWFYHNAQPIVASGQTQPWLWQYHSMPTGPTSTWFSTTPMSSLFVEQSHTPMGYTIRVYSGRPGTLDIEIGLEGHTLVIGKREMMQPTPGMPRQVQQSGWSTQWVSLPADANLAAMRMSRANGLVEVFVPRVR